MRASTFAGLVSLVVAGLSPRAALADPVRVDVGGGTYFPVSVAAEAMAELPFRVLLRGDVGFMPTPYSNTIVDLLGDFSVLTSFQEALLKLAIQNSLVASLSAGWRPFPALGLEVLAGYTLVTIGGGVSGTDVIDAYLQSKGSTDRSPPDAQHDVPIAATLHNFDAGVDWRFLLLDDKLVLRASLAYMQCFASSMSVKETSSRPASQAITSRINQEIAAQLNPYFTEYVKVPVVGVTASYRF